jgi:hypothetical protein
MNLRWLVLFLLLAPYASTQNQEPQFRRDLLAGSWKLNWEKSTPSRPVLQAPAVYRHYQDRADGFMLHTVLQAAPGRLPELQLLGAVKYDNKEYATYTPARLTDLLVSGKQPIQTVSFKVVDPYKLDWADRTSGRITASGKMILAQDGRAMTFTQASFSADGKEMGSSTLIFEKQ